MEYYIRNADEYSNDLRQGNVFAPAWPFRMGVFGSSDSGKTTMLMNLLMGNKGIKEDGERYVLCNDVALIAKHPNEPKWAIIRDFYNELAEEGEDVSFRVFSPNEIPDVEEFDPNRYTVVVFEDLMNMPKKIQEQIADYFSSGRHSNISPVYVSQRFFAIPKTIRENINYISLHRGAGSLPDIKRIISQYTEHSDILAPVIDDLTLKKEFIVFDLRRSRDDPLSIRVRWDTSLRSILDQSQIEPRSVNVLSMTNLRPNIFSSYGRKAITEAKKNGLLIEYARNFPNPKERKVLLAEGVIAKNKDIWTRYIFREAYGISGKDLGPEWIKFQEQVKGKDIKPARSLNNSKKIISELVNTTPLSDKKFIEGCETLLWLFSNGHISRKTFCNTINAIH
jgi:hypothetical protein